MADARLNELIAESERLKKEIARLKREKNKAEGIKIVRYGTGKLVLKIVPVDELDSDHFKGIAAGWSINELIVNAKLVVSRINEICNKDHSEIEEMMTRG